MEKPVHYFADDLDRLVEACGGTPLHGLKEFCAWRGRLSLVLVEARYVRTMPELKCKPGILVTLKVTTINLF